MSTWLVRHQLAPLSVWCDVRINKWDICGIIDEWMESTKNATLKSGLNYIILLQSWLFRNKLSFGVWYDKRINKWYIWNHQGSKCQWEMYSQLHHLTPILAVSQPAGPLEFDTMHVLINEIFAAIRNPYKTGINKNANEVSVSSYFILLQSHFHFANKLITEVFLSTVLVM